MLEQSSSPAPHWHRYLPSSPLFHPAENLYSWLTSLPLPLLSSYVNKNIHYANNILASQVLDNLFQGPFFHCISVTQIHGQLLELVNRHHYPCQNSKFTHPTLQHPSPSLPFISFSISTAKNSSSSLNLLIYWFSITISQPLSVPLCSAYFFSLCIIIPCRVLLLPLSPLSLHHTCLANPSPSDPRYTLYLSTNSSNSIQPQKTIQSDYILNSTWPSNPTVHPFWLSRIDFIIWVFQVPPFNWWFHILFHWGYRMSSCYYHQNYKIMGN